MPPSPIPVLTIEPTAECPRSSEGAFLVEDGRVSFAYTRFTGGGRDNSAAHISLRRAIDRGRVWGRDRVLVENEGDENVMSVSIMPLPDGEVLLFYLVKNGWADCQPHVRRSSDGLETLGDPVRITDEVNYYVMNNDRVVRLSNGRLVAPLALHRCEDGTRETWQGRGDALCYLSDDDGRTWFPSATVLTPPDEAGKAGFQEPGVVELRGGRLWMFIRTGSGFLWQSLSDDGGDTWQTPTQTTLASPLSPASCKRIPDTRDLLLVWNDHSGRHPFPEGKRTPLCVAYSKDEGATWSESHALESDPDGWYCYTAIDFIEGHALLAYCAGDAQVGRLSRQQITVVPIEWIYA